MIENDMKNRPNDFNELTLDEVIENIKKYVESYVKQGTMQYNWFFDRYITENCHIQDFDKENGSLTPVLKSLEKYSKLSKDNKKKMPLNKYVSFQQLIDFIDKNKFKEKNNIDKPNLTQIHVDGANSYHVFTLHGNNYQDFQEMNQKYKNSVSWCVVRGTVKWGEYLTSKYPNYYFITDSNYNPILLMNFGEYSQIKNVHNMFFSQYNKEIFNIINYLATKDGFDIQASGSSDFDNYITIKKILNEQIKQNDLDFVSQLKGFNFYKDKNKLNLYYIYKDNKCQAIFTSKDIIIINKAYKIDNTLLEFIINYTKIDVQLFCYYIIISKKIQQQQDFFTIYFDYAISNIDHVTLCELITDKIVTRKRNDLIQYIINKIKHLSRQLIEKINLLDYNQPYMQKIFDLLKQNSFVLYDVIANHYDLLQNNNTLQIIKNIIIKGNEHYLPIINLLLKKNIISKDKDENFYNELIKQYISILDSASKLHLIKMFDIKKDSQFYNAIINETLKLNPASLLTSEQLKQNQQPCQIAIDQLINEKSAYQLENLILNGHITRNNKKYQNILNFLCENTAIYDLLTMVLRKKIKKTDPAYNKIINKLCEGKGAFGIFKLIKNKFITTEDEKFDEFIQIISNYNNQYVQDLIFNGIITDYTKDYVKTIAEKIIQNGYCEPNITSKNVKFNKLYMIVEKNIINQNDQLYPKLIDCITKKHPKILYYLFFNSVIKNNRNDFFELLEKLPIDLISNLLTNKKINLNSNQLKKILKLICNQYSWLLIKIMKENILNEQMKQYVIKLLIKDKTNAYIIYEMITRYIITQKNNLFQTCINYLINLKFNKRLTNKLLNFIYSAQLKNKIIQYTKNKNKLSSKLLKLSNLLIANKQDFYNQAIDIFYNIKNTKLITNLSQKSSNDIHDNQATMSISFNKKAEFIDKMIIILQNQQNAIKFICNVICNDTIYDNEYYIPIQKILANMDKQFNKNNATKKIKDYVQDLFDKFYKIYQKQQQSKIIK